MRLEVHGIELVTVSGVDIQGSGLEAASLQPRQPDSGAGQEQAEQAAWGHQPGGVPPAGLPASGHAQLPCPAGLE